MGDNFANNFETTLTNSVDTDDTAWTVGGSTGAPTVPFKCAIFNAGAVTEIITVTAASGTSWTVTRATEVTAGYTGGQSHSAGAIIKHVLTAGSLNQAVQGFIGCKAYNNAGQTIGGLDSPLLLNSEEFDTDGFHSTSSNTSRLTIPAGLGGKYFIVAGTYVTGGATGAYLRKNGSTRLRSGRLTLANNEYGTVSAIEDLVAGDYVEFVGGNFSGLTYGDGSDLNAMTSLAIYKMDSGRVGSGIGARATIASTNITTATFTPVPLDTEDFDTDGFHSVSSNTSRMTIPAGLGGRYIAVAHAYTPNNSSGVRYFMIYKNGSEYAAIKDDAPSNSGGFGFAMTPTAILNLVPTDYVEFYVYQNSGSTLDYAASLSLMRLDSASATYTGSKWGSGTVFPSGPATNDRFTRTDLGIDFFWDGTRWLSTEIYTGSYPMRDTGTFPISAAGSFYGGPPIPITTQVWFIGIMFTTYVTTTNNGSHYWIITPGNGGGAAFNTSADGVDTLKTHYVAVGSALNIADSWYTFSHTKNGSPGNLWVTANTAWRYIGT